MMILQTVAVFSFVCVFWIISAAVWSFEREQLINTCMFNSLTSQSAPGNIIQFMEECTNHFGVVLERKPSTILEGIYNNSYYPYQYDVYLYSNTDDTRILQIRIGVCPDNYTFSSNTMSSQIGLRLPTWNLSNTVFVNMTLQNAGILPRTFGMSSDILFEVMYADTRIQPYGEYISNTSGEIHILSGVSEWDNLRLDPRRSAMFDTRIRTTDFSNSQITSESYCENTVPEPRSTTYFSHDFQVADCEDALHIYKQITLEYLHDFDPSFKYNNISLDIDDVYGDCKANNTFELRIDNLPFGAIGFISNDSRFIKNWSTYMDLFS